MMQNWMRTRGPEPTHSKIVRIVWAILATGILFVGPCPNGPLRPGFADTPTMERSTIVEGIPITMREAVLRALKIRPLRKIDKDRIKNLRSFESQTRSSFYPQISASYQNTYGNSFLGFFLFPNYQFVDAQLVTVTLTQLIFDFGRTSSQVSERKWSVRAQKDVYQQTSQALIRDVENAYYALLGDIEQETVTHLNVIDARNHLDASLVRLTAGMGLKADVIQAKVNLSNAILERIQAVNVRKKAQIILATTIGDTKERHYVPVVDFSLPSGLRARLGPDLDKAERENPSVLQARHSLVAAEESLKAAWRQNYPSVNGLAQYFLAQIPPQAFPFPGLPNYPYSSFAIGGVLNIPIFEGGGNLAQIHQARAFLSESVHHEDEAELNVSSQVRQAFLDIMEARQQLAESRTEVENALEYDRLEAGSYSVGKATALDVIDAQTALRKARADLVTSKYSLAQKVVLYHYAVGDLSPP
jgi:outer membrane protein